ncbi:MAG TPA: Ni/Fe-hydrogenase cytochrome b subunit [Thermodesulfobacteriota bacterium]|nr:Ni/Fe-hydrogenase cytochrome b subunit [Thermodesulfobacteriota bacterium]
MKESVKAGEIKSVKDFLVFIRGELKPKGKIFTPFNVISVPIILVGLILIVIRLVKGLGSVTNLSQDFPWGIWIGFDVMVGVAFAGGAYILTFVVYILRSEKYHPVVRATVLNGFLAYVFYAGAIFLDLGRWWNIINPIFGNKFGVNSVLFLVSWHFLLYMISLFIEFSPAFAEWLGFRRVRKILASLTLGAVVFGIALSTLHQSGLGALLMMAKDKIHPLWYTEFIPVFFFVSSIFAGLSMVIFEGTISHRVFADQIDHEHQESYNSILIGLGKGCAGALFVYFFMKILLLIHGKQWALLATPMGTWYLVELIGLTLLPCVLFLHGVRYQNVTVIRMAAILSMLGIIINRLNYTVIAYKWYVPLSQRYIPSWGEITVTLAIILTEVWVFRWIANRMPVFRESPAWVTEEQTAKKAVTIRKEVPKWKVSAM